MKKRFLTGKMAIVGLALLLFGAERAAAQAGASGPTQTVPRTRYNTQTQARPQTQPQPNRPNTSNYTKPQTCDQPRYNYDYYNGYQIPTYPGPNAPLPPTGGYYNNPYNPYGYNNGYYNNGYYNNGYYNNGYYNNGYYNNGQTHRGTSFPPFQGYNP